MDVNDLDDDLIDDNVNEDIDDSRSDIHSGEWSLVTDDDEDSGFELFKETPLESNDDALTRYLADNGINDINKIKFEDENGDIVEKSWKDLSSEEQLNILRSNVREPEEGLEDDEVAFINYLRSNGLSPQLYHEALILNMQSLIQAVSQQTLVEPEPSFTSDLLTDDELFILDLELRVPDLTDEEAANYLAKAKEDEEFYLKLIGGIRAEYQRLEQEQREQQAAILLLEYQEAYAQYSNNIINEIQGFSNIGDLDVNMDENDMDELARFILSSDEAGVNYFLKALLDPQTLVLMAWFALHGEEVFNGIADYYNQEIVKAEKAGYEKGKAAKKQAKQTPEVVVKLPKKLSKSYKTLEDLDDDF